ncbi:Transposable element Tc1 transposase protein [Rutstroemia sp. NJR-2017a BBW]|nr:Transposable element Tc1 transposase protein [Rutstroemia sp. NJR-2017a BBW]
MATTISVPTPKTPTRRELSRDDRLRIQTLYFDANWDRTKICLQTNFTYDQINYALTHRLTPQKQKTGRHVVLNTPQRKRLIEWVTASPENRETQWCAIPGILGWDCGEKAIRTAFKKEGFRRLLEVHSMRDRCIAVIEAKGYSTKY